MDYKLQELLTNRNQILIQIIRLISEEERWYSIQEISREIGLVERSILRYIIFLEDLIGECNKAKEAHYVLQIKKNKGVHLVIEERDNYLYLKNYIYEVDETIKVLTALLFERYESAAEYSQKSNMSSYTVKHSLHKIQDLVKDVDLQVSHREFKITGDEAQIRIISCSVSWVLFNSAAWPRYFHQVDPFKVESSVEFLMSSLHLEMNTIKKREISFMIAISILRFRQGNVITYPFDWEPYVPLDSQFELNKTIETILKNFHIHSHSEVRFMVLNMMMKPFMYKLPHFKNKIINSHRVNGSDILSVTDLFMEEFDESVCPIPSDEYEDVYGYVFRSHLFAKVYKQVDFDYSGHSFLHNIETKFPNYYQKIGKFIDNLMLKSGNEIFLEKEYLIQIYFMVISFSQLNNMFEKSIKVYVQTDLSELHETRMKKLLFDRFKYEFNLIFIDSNNMQVPDIILTNIVLEEHKKKAILISYPIGKRDILKIREALTSFSRREHMMTQKVGHEHQDEYLA